MKAKSGMGIGWLLAGAAVGGLLLLGMRDKASADTNTPSPDPTVQPLPVVTPPDGVQPGGPTDMEPPVVIKPGPPPPGNTVQVSAAIGVVTWE